MTKRQKWAKERNFSKFRLNGIMATLKNLSKSKAVLPVESTEIRRAMIVLGECKGAWKDRTPKSRQRYERITQ